MSADVDLTATPPAPRVALGIAFSAMLAVVTVTDLKRRVIPNRVLFAAAAAALAIAASADPGSLAARLSSALAAGGIFCCIALAYPRGLGMGDVKLVAVMGLYLGVAIVPAVLVGFASGALAGVVIVARHGAAARKRAIPFGPFLALGGLAGLLAGDSIVRWYAGSFLGS